MYTETEGLVLKQVKIAGGRRMIHIFTQKYGKISVGTGLTEGNNKSKAALSIRPFTYGKYEISKNREYYNLNGSEVKKSYYSLGEDLDKYAAASLALELTDKVLPEELPQPRLFSILLDFMKALEKGRHHAIPWYLYTRLRCFLLWGIARFWAPAPYVAPRNLKNR